MYYAEVVFARGRLLWVTLIFLAMAATFTYFVSFPPAGVHIVNAGQDAWFNPVLVGASIGASIMASLLGGKLNRDQSHLAYIWTRPVHRVWIALGAMFVDVVTILLSYAAIVAICAAVLVVPPQNHIVLDSQTAAILARTIAVPLMFYALLEAATSWSAQRIGGAVGIFWGCAWLALILGQVLPFPLAQLLHIVNLLNPIAYVPDSHGHGVNVVLGFAQPRTSAVFFAARTVLAYCIFFVACIVAVYNRNRMEV